MLRSEPQMLKKWRIVVNKISKVRQTTCNWIKKILDKATRIVNVLLISGFFYLFLLCSISLLVKYAFILRYEAWVNAIRASSFIENFPQISAKPIAFQQNLLGKLLRNRPFFTNRFSTKLASKIPAKFPRNRPIFPRICPWKSREIWLFFPRPTRSPDKLKNILQKAKSDSPFKLQHLHSILFTDVSNLIILHLQAFLH